MRGRVPTNWARGKNPNYGTVDTMTNYRETALAAYGGKEPGRMKASITREIGIKRCSTCREWMPVDRFTPDKGRTDGLANRCRECVGKAIKRWHARPENAGKQAEYTRKSRYSTPEARERTARNRLRDRCKAYGITVEDHAAMLEAQGGGCAICGTTPEENGRALAIDHDHACCPEQLRSCGKCVRGLLCSACNIAVGYFEQEETRMKCEEYVMSRRG